MVHNDDSDNDGDGNDIDNDKERVGPFVSLLVYFKVSKCDANDVIPLPLSLQQ